jgi:hypothetical protein
MVSQFLNSFIPDATILNIDIGEGIYYYEHQNSIYVLVDVAVIGLITQDLKEEIAKKLENSVKSILYFSMFENRLHFAKSGEIVWGTYAWFANEPKHYIHFDDHPSEKIITHQIFS